MRNFPSKLLCIMVYLCCIEVVLAQDQDAPTVSVTTGEWIAAKEQPGIKPTGLPIFRKVFSLKNAPVSAAEVSICGLGHFELSINGNKVGDHVLDPAWSDYADTCYFVTFDVKDLLKPGENVIGVMLGNGMYNVKGGRYTKFKKSYGPPKLNLALTIKQGGAEQVIKSDDSWKSSDGPTTFSCIYGGEDYDARLEQPGWDKPGFDDSKWSPAAPAKGPEGKARHAISPPIKVVRKLQPVSVKKLGEMSYEVDLGENLSSIPTLTVKGPAGATVKVEVAERMGQKWEGHSYSYTLKGSPEPESFVPRFTYFGFQYLYVTGAVWKAEAENKREQPVLMEIGANFVSSCGPRIGGFSCSVPLLNEIDAMIDRSVVSNLGHVLTDCPHREKLGWLEVPHLMGPSILFRYDMGGLFRKICRDTTDSQLNNGLIPCIAPEYTRFNGGFFHSPEWGSAAVQVPSLIYRWYGDASIFEDQYTTMARYTDYLASTRNDKGLVKGGLGDWYDWTPKAGHKGYPQLTRRELPATVMLYDNARIMAEAAALTGKTEDVKKWQALGENVKQAFISNYYRESNHSIDKGSSQAAMSLGLYFDLIPESGRDGVLANLIGELEKNGYCTTTGEVTFRYLIQALAQAGRSDVVYRIINRTTRPGYGYMIKEYGLKTLSESWDKPGSSLNHCMFGHAQEWFQNYLLGIRQAPGSIGWKKVLIDPYFPEDMEWAKGFFDSPNGRIEVAWVRKDGKVEVTIKSHDPKLITVPERKDVEWKIQKLNAM